MNKIIMKFAPLLLFLLTNCQDQGQNQTKTVADRYYCLHLVDQSNSQ